MGVFCNCQPPVCAPLQQEGSKDHGNPIYVEVLTTQYKVRSHASCESYRQSKKGSANYMLCRWTNELNHEYGQVTGCIQNFRTELKETITFFRTQKLQCTIMDEKLHIELRNPLHFRIQNSLQVPADIHLWTSFTIASSPTEDVGSRCLSSKSSSSKLSLLVVWESSKSQGKQ